MLQQHTSYPGITDTINSTLPPSTANLFRSMVADVVVAASLEKGIRREELFYAFFVFGNKFSAGITLGVSTGIYK